MASSICLRSSFCTAAAAFGLMPARACSDDGVRLPAEERDCFGIEAGSGDGTVGVVMAGGWWM